MCTGNVTVSRIALQAIEQGQARAVGQRTSSRTPVGGSSVASAKPSSVVLGDDAVELEFVREVVQDAGEGGVVFDDEDQPARPRQRSRSSANAPRSDGAGRRQLRCWRPVGAARRVPGRQWRARASPCAPAAPAQRERQRSVNVLPAPTRSSTRSSPPSSPPARARSTAQPGAAVLALRAAVGLPERLEDDVELVARDARCRCPTANATRRRRCRAAPQRDPPRR